MQGVLLFGGKSDKKKSIVNVPIGEVVLSRFNPRSIRSDDDIKKLSERIERNGFEITRALWAYKLDDMYHVFAGGNRLAASAMADLKTVPIVLHEGFTDYEISGLADEDNENDEYHAKVPIVDVWMDYKRLRDDEGWTQQQIADAKGLKNRTVVSFRLDYADFPDSVLERFVTNDFLVEGHAREIKTLLQCNNEPAVPTESVMLHVIDSVIEKRGNKCTSKHFEAAVLSVQKVLDIIRANVDKLTGVTELQTETNGQFEVMAYDAVGIYTSYVINGEWHSKRFVNEYYQTMQRHIAESKKAYADHLSAEAEAEAEKIQVEIKHGQWWQLGEHRIYCGDTSKPEFWHALKNDDIAFGFADPPYNADAAEWDNDFSWGHDWLQSVSAVVAVTCGISAIKDFMSVVDMEYAWSLSCHISNGMTRGALGFGNWMYSAIFATESIHKNAQDAHTISIKTGDSEDENFKGRKPSAFMEWIIDLFTEEGETVVDPFLGSGTTLKVCHAMDRRCIGGELDIDRFIDLVEWWDSISPDNPAGVIK